MRTLTIEGKTIPIPEQITWYSKDQEEDYTTACMAFYNINMPQEERQKGLMDLYPLFAAFFVQPLRDGFYSFENVCGLHLDLKRHKNQKEVIEIGQLFCMAVALQSARKLAGEVINIYQSN